MNICWSQLKVQAKVGSIYQVCRKCKMDVHEKFVLVQASVKNELEKFQVNRWQTYFRPIENCTFQYSPTKTIEQM